MQKEPFLSVNAGISLDRALLEPSLLQFSTAILIFQNLCEITITGVSFHPSLILPSLPLYLDSPIPSSVNQNN